MGQKSFDIEHFKEKLAQLRENLLAVEKSGKEAAKPVELDQSRVGRISRMDAIQAQSMAIEAKRRRENKIKAVGAAFERIKAGEFGFCLDCGEEIAEKRLEFDPTVLLCIECAKRREK